MVKLFDRLADIDYLAPNIDDREDKKLAWINMTIKQGKQYLESQSGYKQIARSRDVIMGMVKDRMPKSLSNLTLNRPKRQVREIVATLSNLRARFEYKTDNKDYYGQAQLLNRLGNSWWLNTFADRKIKEGLQYAAVDGLGWVSLSWDREFWSSGRGEIVPHVYAADQVIPYQIGSDHDIQRAYSVTIINKVPLAQAHAMFRSKAHIIKPDLDLITPNTNSSGFGSMWKSPVLGLGKSESIGSPWPTVELRYTYVIDSTINTTTGPKQMGIAGSTWSYTVPQVGGNVLQGYDHKGQKQFRKATEEDALLFPLRRLIISTSTAVLYDGSNTYWHGKVPVTALMFDKWPWEYLPFGLIGEVQGLSASNNTIMRAIDDAQKVRLRPPMAYDNRVISEEEMRKLDLRLEGQTMGVDFSMADNPIRPIIPQQHWDVPNWIRDHLQDNENRADYLIGVADFNALAKAKQIPSGDTMEALLQAVGPLVQDMTRSMEHSVRDIGNQWKGMCFQFYDKSRIIQIQGNDQAALTEMSFDPMLLIPKYMPGEREDVGEESAFSRTERARKHINSFYMFIEPNSISQTQAMSKRLMYLQLFRGGFPIDPWTVAEVLEIDNFAPPPKGCNNIMERWVAWKHIQNEQAIEAAQLMQQIEMGAATMGASGQIPQTTGSNIPTPGLGSPGQGSGIPGQAGPGRPPSGQKPPQLEAKSDGRPVISES